MYKDGRGLFVLVHFGMFEQYSKHPNHNYVHPTGGWTYYFCFFRRPLSGVTLGFRSFQGKVFIPSLPNLVWVFIGLIACMALLLVKIAL